MSSHSTESEPTQDLAFELKLAQLEQIDRLAIPLHTSRFALVNVLGWEGRISVSRNGKSAEKIWQIRIDMEAREKWTAWK